MVMSGTSHTAILAVFLLVLVALLYCAAQLAFHPNNYRTHRGQYLVPISGWTVNADEGTGDWYHDDNVDEKYISLFPNHPDHPDYKGLDTRPKISK